MAEDNFLGQIIQNIHTTVQEMDRKLDVLTESHIKTDTRVKSLEETRDTQKRAARWAGATLLATIMGWLGVK